MTGIKVQLAAEVEARLASREMLQEMGADLRREIAALRAQKPRLRPLVKATVMPSSGIGVIVFGSPPNGYIWHVRRNVITGSEPLSTVSGGTVGAFVGTPVLEGSAAAELSAADLVDWTQTIPDSTTYGRNEVPVQDTDVFYLAISGVASATNLVGAIVVTEELVGVGEYGQL